MIARILDWRMRRLRREFDLPDLPEVRRLFRMSWLNGFTFGAFEREVAAARREALKALEKGGRYDQAVDQDL
jgi:hypothetical protein